MTETDLYKFITIVPLRDLIVAYPLTLDFLENMRIQSPTLGVTLAGLLDALDDTTFEEFGLRKADIPMLLCRFLQELCKSDDAGMDVVSLTILGGRNKSGEMETAAITLTKGEVAAIVGPTGSGKSRLLADIECLAQRDTPTNRQIFINGQEVTEDRRFDMNGKLVAQLSQNMNFIMDLSVREFLEMHARSRFSNDIAKTVESCMTCANDLAGEHFGPETKVTQLSGGQSRALMIADTAFMSMSPLVLIDEIENAGIDRKKAVKVLTKSDKIVLIATHDPLLALGADKRIVIKNGGIVKVINSSQVERSVLAEIEKMDNTVQSLRNRLRAGEIITGL